MGKNTQAEKLTPVVEELRSAVSTANNPNTLINEPTGVFTQNDFKTLLNLAQNSPPHERSIPPLTSVKET
jgi:hypothetical protein